MVERVFPRLNLSRGGGGTIRRAVNARGGAVVFRPFINRTRWEHRVAIGRDRYTSDRAETDKTGKYARSYSGVVQRSRLRVHHGRVFGDVGVRVIAGVGRHIAFDWFGGGDIVTFGERVGERVRRRVAAVRGEAGF